MTKREAKRWACREASTCLLQRYESGGMDEDWAFDEVPDRDRGRMTAALLELEAELLRRGERRA